jgi:hypothetical protein
MIVGKTREKADVEGTRGDVDLDGAAFGRVGDALDPCFSR